MVDCVGPTIVVQVPVRAVLLRAPGADYLKTGLRPAPTELRHIGSGALNREGRAGSVIARLRDFTTFRSLFKPRFDPSLTPEPARGRRTRHYACNARSAQSPTRRSADRGCVTIRIRPRV
jgi:hypothetical protein